MDRFLKRMTEIEYFFELGFLGFKDDADLNKLTEIQINRIQEGITFQEFLNGKETFSNYAAFGIRNTKDSKSK